MLLLWFLLQWLVFDWVIRWCGVIIETKSQLLLLLPLLLPALPGFVIVVVVEVLVSANANDCKCKCKQPQVQIKTTASENKNNCQGKQKWLQVQMMASVNNHGDYKRLQQQHKHKDSKTAAIFYRAWIEIINQGAKTTSWLHLPSTFTTATLHTLLEARWIVVNFYFTSNKKQKKPQQHIGHEKNQPTHQPFTLSSPSFGLLLSKWLLWKHQERSQLVVWSLFLFHFTVFETNTSYQWWDKAHMNWV